MTQLSSTPDRSTLRYPFHQNDAVRPPRKRKQLQNEYQLSSSPKITTNIQIKTVTTNRRSNSVQTQSKQQRIHNRNVKIDRSEYQGKLKLKKLWELLSQNLRRSKQRIELFHSSRKIYLENVWKFYARVLNRKNRIYSLKEKIFKAAFIIINQIFSRNRFKLIPTSYVSKQLLNKLNNSRISSVLSELIRIYYNRLKNKETGVPLSIIMTDIHMNTEMDTLLSHSKMYELVREAFLHSPIEICENDIDDQTAEELIPVINFYTETKEVSGNPLESLANLTRLTRRDIRLAVNDRIVSNLVQDVYDQIDYPITLNTPDEAAVSSIVSSLTIEDSLSFIPPPDLESIFDITQKDMKIYVNKRMIDGVINHIIHEIDLPVQLNTVSDLTAREIVEDDVFDDVIESELTIPYINNNFEIEENKSCLVKMLSLTSVDVRMYFSGRFVDDMIDSLYNDICFEFPITLNIPSEETCREIVDIDEYNNYPFGDYVENEKEVANWVDPVCRYEPKDVKLYVNRRTISRVVGKIFSQIKNSLPIIPNTVDQSTIEDIVSMPIEDSFMELPMDANKPIKDYKAKDIQLYVNDRIIDDIVDDTFNSFKMPIVPNEVTQEQIDEILEDDFHEAMELFSNVDEWIDSLLNVDYSSRRISLDKSVVSRTVNHLLSKILFNIPVIQNTVNEETIDEILDCTEENCDEFEKSSINAIDPLVDVSNLSIYESTDMRMYVCQRDLDDMIVSIFEDTDLPIAFNDVDDSEIEEITKTDLEDTFLGLPIGFPQPIDIFQPKDIQVYVNDRFVDNYMFQVINTFKLPLSENTVSPEDIDEILEEEDFGDAIPPIAERGIEDSLVPLIDCLDPLERPINFNFPINGSMFAREAINNIPLTSNEVSQSEIDSILTYFDDKIAFKRSPDDSIELPLDALDPLKRYVAPLEVFESVDDVVERIMNRILSEEILPSMPLDQAVVVGDDTANAILTMLSKRQPDKTLINQQSIFEFLITEPKTIFNVEPLLGFDIVEPPETIKPDDIINGILWHEVLQALPLAPTKKKIIDFLDVVDQIVIDNYMGKGALNMDSEKNMSSRSNKSNKSSKSSRSNRSNRSNRSSALNEMIENLLTDSDNSYEIEENLPYLMTSSSPTPSSPSTNHQQKQQMQMQQQAGQGQKYFKSLLDTSSESFVGEDEVNKKNSFSSKKKSEVIEEIVVDADDTNNESLSFSFEGSPGGAIKIEKVEIEEEEEEIIDDNFIKTENQKIEKTEKIEKIETKVNIVKNEVIIEEEEEDNDEFDVDIDVDIDLNDAGKEEEDNISDFISE